MQEYILRIAFPYLPQVKEKLKLSPDYLASFVAIQ